MTQGLSERTRRSNDDLRVLAEEAARRFAPQGGRREADTDTVLAWAAEEFGAHLAVASSMADAVLPHVVSRHVPGVDVLFIDTGYHFPETLETRNVVADRLDVRVVDVRPRLTVAEQVAAHGPRLHDRDPGACCAMRKVDPLREALGGYEAWVTGVRRADSPARSLSPLVQFDHAHGLVKINPLVAWSDDDVEVWAQVNGVPTNPLLAQGYPSIGCFPCTRPVAPGEDPRSGRWAGTDKTECGIHA